MIIGITGSIGSGKTTVAKSFGRHHFAIINADEISHLLMKKGSVVYTKVFESFGTQILDRKRNISRKKLGEIVFSDSEKLRELNLIMHPAILSEIKNRIREIKDKCRNESRIVIEAPLLLETSAKKLVDKVVVVRTDLRKIITRNRNFSKIQIEMMLKFQMPIGEKIKYADFVVDNNSDLKNLERQVEGIIGKLREFDKSK